MTAAVHGIFTGFAARAGVGPFGWSSVALIRTAKNTVLVDTGGPAHRVELVKRLDRLGLKPDGIDVLLLTHLHWDHAYNFDLFPRAAIMVSEAEWDHARATDDARMYPPTIEALKKRGISTFSGETAELFDGITTISTPGHTPGSVSFAVASADGMCVIAGDAVKNREEWVTGRGVPTFDPAVSRASIDRLKSLGAARCLPGHDVWLEIRDGGIFAESRNETAVTFPEGISMGGEKQISLYMDPSLPHGGK